MLTSLLERFFKARNRVISYAQRFTPPPRHTLLNEIDRRSIIDSANYAEQNMALALSFADGRDLLSYSVRRAPSTGMIAEFGVFRGKSINRIAAEVGSREVFGFDSFEGLQEDWAGTSLPKGAFDRHGQLPIVRNNVKLIAGWFDKTLAGFLDAHPGKFAFLHVDSDTYESVKTIFDLSRGRIEPGTVILFDEYFGYRGWRIGEFLAWQEFVAAASVKYRYLGFSVQETAVIIDEIDGRKDA